jgi:hypothetical protein
MSRNKTKYAEKYMVLAHRSKCSYYGKYILNAFQNVKKFRHKIEHSMFIHQNYGEKTFLVTCVKKKQLNSNLVAREIVFFSIGHKKMPFSRKT